MKTFIRLLSLCIPVSRWRKAFRRHVYQWYQNRRAQRRLRALNGRRITIDYRRNDDNLIAHLCQQYGSDKGATCLATHPLDWSFIHSYCDFYETLFHRNRINVKRLLECGIGTNNLNLESTMGESGQPGASLRMWRDYFPNAQIVGVDIDADILFEESRITTAQLDQTDPTSIAQFKETQGDSKFDIIIDDGLHTFNAAKTLFEGFFDLLADDGVYIIEDMFREDTVRFDQYFRQVGVPSVQFVNFTDEAKAIAPNQLVVLRKKCNCF